MSRTTKISIAFALAVLVLSAGGASFARNSAPGAGGDLPDQPCGRPVTNGSGPDATVAFTPCPGDEPPVVHPQMVEPTTGSADVHARPFEPCSVLDHVDVAYAADTVTITLFEGHDPSAGDVACIDIAALKRVVITLDRPLGDPTIVDGAAPTDQRA